MMPDAPRRTAFHCQPWCTPGLLAVAMAVLPGFALAEPPWARREPRAEWHAAEQRRVVITLDQAVQEVEHRFRARVVRAGTVETEGRRIYVLKLLSEQGRVWTVRIDAETGALN